MSEHWKNPYEFHPERWLGDPEYKDDHLDALEPFSVGPRNCLGKVSILGSINVSHRMLIVVSRTSRGMRCASCLRACCLHFDLKLCEESADWSDQKVYTLWEKVPLLCTLTRVKA